MRGTGWLLVGGALSAIAAATHLGAVVAGGPGYRLLGAGEPFARAAEQGLRTPALVTMAIAAVLATAATYAVSGAGLIRSLPLLRSGLVVISLAYLARGAVLFAPSLLARPDLSAGFLFWSSAIVLGFGVAHAVGTWRAWPTLESARDLMETTR